MNKCTFLMAMEVSMATPLSERSSAVVFACIQLGMMVQYYRSWRLRLCCFIRSVIASRHDTNKANINCIRSSADVLMRSLCVRIVMALVFYFLLGFCGKAL